MQDMLVPIFGESGAIIAQYVISLAVVIALIALVVWGIRHFGGNSVRPAARGRLPRLAIVDTLPVDNKRKLVLLRRDNVEHLILIGGPSDVVVEPSIVRQRVAQRVGQGSASRPQATATSAEAPPPAPAAAPLGENDEPAYTPEPAPAPVQRPPPLHLAPAGPDATESAVPFVPRRSYAASADRGARERAPVERSAPEREAAPHRDSLRGTMQATASPTSEASRPHRSFTPAATVPARSASVRSEADPEAQPAIAARTPPVSTAPEPSRFAPHPIRAVAAEPPDGPVPGYEATEADDHDKVSAFAPPGPLAEAATAPESHYAPAEAPDGNIEVLEVPAMAESEAPADEADAESVSELEQEMARLLNQISTSRRE